MTRCGTPQRHNRLHRTMAPARLLQVIMMVKDPIAGHVKTRLAHGIGVARATAFYRTTLLCVVRRVNRPQRWSLRLAVAPDRAVASRLLPPGVRRMPQGLGDLGDRMTRLLQGHVFPGRGFRGREPGATVIIGSDVPAIRDRHIRKAFRLLCSHDVVLGPSPDGGYWLIGLAARRRRPIDLSGVRWSTSNALEDTASRFAGYRMAFMESLDDVDTAADVKACGRWIGRTVPPLSSVATTERPKPACTGFFARSDSALQPAAGGARRHD
jgi:hypothetical protein